MELRLKAKASKKVFSNGDFYIYGFVPITPYPDNLKLSKYFNFTCKGNLSWVTEGKEYDISIEELSTDRYGTSYKITSVYNMNIENLEDLSYDESMEILTEITTSAQAKNILDAYPNFIYLSLNQGIEAFDVSKIYNVGEYRLNAYTRELNVKYKYLAIMNNLKEWKVDVTDCKRLCDIYHEEDEIKKALTDHPYKVLISDLEKPFEPSDKLIMENAPQFRESEERCAYVILNVLQKNEMEGSTRVNANSVYNYILNEYTQAKDIQDLIVPTVINNEMFYYNEETKDLAIMTTYLAECRIADFVKDKVENPHILDIDWKNYQTVDGFTLTDSQLGLLENFCKYDFMVLAGFAGSGKTASVKNLITLMEDNHISYTLLSSTGKASKVLSEATNRTASTIHRRCFQGEINSDCVIIDECGMVNLDTFSMFLNAIENDSMKIILCGDP